MKNTHKFFLPVILALYLPVTAHAQIRPSERYGPLFKAVQMSHIFNDSKIFPDMIARHSPGDIMNKYEEARQNPDFDLKQFVLDNFEMPPSSQSHFESNKELSVAEHINRLWPVLTRQPDTTQHSSLIPLPHPYVVPGGRFREIYYWDTYFTILGLWHSNEINLIKNMVDNFAYLIDEYGFIPNGNRTYYLSRSQPPFFPLMVQALADARGNPKIMVQYLPELQREYDFWMKGSQSLTTTNRAVRNVVQLDANTNLNRYWDNTPRPRPEAFREDSLLALHSNRRPAQLYRDLRAAAESGWDFSSRWLDDNGKLSSIHTTDIIPVDLNSLLYHYEKTLAKTYALKGNQSKANAYQQKATNRKKGILKYCWDPRKHIFTDYNFRQQETTGVISVASLYPLFFNIATQKGAAETVALVQNKLLAEGGILTTPNDTGQQWDKPNGWAPLQWIAYKGLTNYGYDALADTLRKRWVGLNQRVFHQTGKMMEKYNVVDPDVKAGGGEYPLQDGFGWTNGVYMQFKAIRK